MRDEVMVARDIGVTAEVRQVMSTTSTRASTITEVIYLKRHRSPAQYAYVQYCMFKISVLVLYWCHTL